MPIYAYRAKDQNESCSYYREGFEYLQKSSDPPLHECPKCGAPVRKLISSCSIGTSKSGVDDRARSAGFHKLEKPGKGEYEQKY
jgi:putative FmdB family regulatory protein